MPQKWLLEIALFLEKEKTIDIFKFILTPEILSKKNFCSIGKQQGVFNFFFSCFLCLQEKDVMITPMPFARPQDLGPSIAIVTKVNQIQDQLLKKHDIELYMHLNRLEIAPQIYGL